MPESDALNHLTQNKANQHGFKKRDFALTIENGENNYSNQGLIKAWGRGYLQKYDHLPGTTPQKKMSLLPPATLNYL